MAVVDQPALGLEDHARGLLAARFAVQLPVSEDLDREEPDEEKAVERESDQDEKLETSQMKRAHRVPPASTGAAGRPTMRSVRNAGSALRTPARIRAARAGRRARAARGRFRSTSTTREGSGF